MSISLEYSVIQQQHSVIKYWHYLFLIHSLIQYFEMELENRLRIAKAEMQRLEAREQFVRNHIRSIVNFLIIVTTTKNWFSVP